MSDFFRASYGRRRRTFVKIYEWVKSKGLTKTYLVKGMCLVLWQSHKYANMCHILELFSVLRRLKHATHNLMVDVNTLTRSEKINFQRFSLSPRIILQVFN